MSVSYGGSSITFEDGSIVSSGSAGFKNKIINGAMMIDQRNSGASVTPADAAFTLDRWRFFLSQASKLTMQQNQGSISGPAGFPKYLGITSSSAYTVGSGERFSLMQSFESANVYEFAWGTSDAKTVTLSFWVRSSLTGTFGGAVRNWAYTYSYPFTYTINTQNTWEYKTITIPGPTSGTWVMDGSNAGSIELLFNLGAGSTYSGTSGSWASANYTSATGATSVVGTNAATFYITGVQLEKGTTASSFEYRSYTSELALCERYCRRLGDGLTGVCSGTGAAYFVVSFSPPMRATPTVTLTDVSVKITDNYSADYTSSASAITDSSLLDFGGRINVNGFTSITTGRVYQIYGNTNGYIFLFSAEL